MIYTTRLKLLPLTQPQLLLYLQPDHALEADLQITEGARDLSPELIEAFEQVILPNVADPAKNHLYSTLWTIILQSERKMVGDICFTGPPNEDGAIEIGYGTYQAYQNQGIMTEAVGGMLHWAKTQTDLKTMLAQTDKSNTASGRILEKNQFEQYGETTTTWCWRVKLR